jgi:hypothetical protein
MSGDMIKGAPADPVFWSHHAMLDLIWASWQDKDPLNAVEYDKK